MSIIKIMKIHNNMYVLQPFNVSTTHTYEIIINATICATLVGWVER
jgi:hypothetical protein